MKPSRLGQNFLENQNAIDKIVRALKLEKNDFVIEIGPGKGALTFPLARECARKECRLIAIEKDPVLAKDLINKIYDSKKSEGVEIVTGDALKLLTAYALNLKSYKLAGNIPYYITGRLLRIISELGQKPSLSVLTLQREVAERVAAQPPRMNLLAAAAQYWAEPEILLILKPSDFTPQPKVESAMIKLSLKQKKNADEDAKYYKFIKILFKQPRKTALGNLRAGLGKKTDEILGILAGFGLSGSERPQDFEVELLIKLAGAFS